MHNIWGIKRERKKLRKQSNNEKEREIQQERQT